MREVPGSIPGTPHTIFDAIPYVIWSLFRSFIISEVVNYVVRKIKALAHLARWIIIFDRLINDCRGRQALSVNA